MTTPFTAGIFPGQGSQAVGMGQELSERYPAARAVFEEADALLGFSISTLCFAGPAEELKRTSIAQPALLTMSTACWRVLQERGERCAVVAGHSLGEYSALVAAGAMTFADAVLLVRRRGLLMEEASVSVPGGMVAVIGLTDEQVQALCDEAAAGRVLAAANYNAPGQVVVSGETEAIAALRALAKERGARAIPLQVSGPFHSPLMAPVAEQFAIDLQRAIISAPAIPVVPNVTAAPTTDPDIIREALTRQITGSVQWVRSLQAMRDMGAVRFIEVGAGNILSGLVQRTLPEATASPITEILAA